MDTQVDLSMRQFSGAWRLMCAGHGRAAVVDGIQYIFAGVPIGFFNVALLDERGVSSDALKTHGERACAWASDTGVPWLFVVTHEALEPGTDAVSVLDGCGLKPVIVLTGMLAPHVARAERIPAGLDLVAPTDDSGCSAILDVNALAYGEDLETGKALIGAQSFWAPHFPVLGLADGKPACSAAVMMIDGYRYVALVATDPEHQRRGYAEAAMRRALEHAADVHGECPSVLHATEAGRPIYERMGYAAISTHTMFMEKRILEGH